MSATHPTRLETRTKESNARASQRVCRKPHGAAKAKARREPGRGGIPAPRRAPGAPSARLVPYPPGEAERERAR